jgi:hypothetical protein
MGKRRRLHVGLWCEIHKERDFYEDLDVEVEDFCEYDNKSSGSIKLWKILEYLSNWLLLKKGSTPWS